MDMIGISNSTMVQPSGIYSDSVLLAMGIIAVSIWVVFTALWFIGHRRKPK